MTETFLGVIAFSTLIMALIQVSVLIGVYLIMRHVEKGIERVEQATRPLLVEAERISREAAATMADARVHISRGGESVEQILQRVETMVERVESIANAPVREGAAIVAGARAVVDALRRPFSPSRHASGTASPGNGHQKNGGAHVGEMRTSGLPM